MDAKKDKDKLFRQVAVYSMLNKYDRKSSDWVGFGWDASTDKLVDVSFYASCEWFEDPEVEKLVKERFKNRKYVEQPESAVVSK